MSDDAVSLIEIQRVLRGIEDIRKERPVFWTDEELESLTPYATSISRIVDENEFACMRVTREITASIDSEDDDYLQRYKTVSVTGELFMEENLDDLDAFVAHMAACAKWLRSPVMFDEGRDA
jgi:hypothetical protein